MTDTLEFITNCILAIQSDEKLKQAFIKVLKIGPSSQQVRVQLLLAEVRTLNPPQDVVNFIQMLTDEQLATRVLMALEES